MYVVEQRRVYVPNFFEICKYCKPVMDLDHVTSHSYMALHHPRQKIHTMTECFISTINIPILELQQDFHYP